MPRLATLRQAIKSNNPAPPSNSSRIGRCLRDKEETRRILVRQWFDERGVDESKDRHAYADPKRYHRGGSSSEGWILAELS